MVVYKKNCSFSQPRIHVTSSLQVMNLIGDVKGKVAVMVDDMIDTAGKWSFSWLQMYIFIHDTYWKHSFHTGKIDMK